MRPQRKSGKEYPERCDLSVRTGFSLFQSLFIFFQFVLHYAVFLSVPFTFVALGNPPPTFGSCVCSLS